MQQSKQIAKNYAQALIELGEGNIQTQETFLNEIKTINESMSQVKSAKLFFENPSVTKNEKKDLLKKLFEEKINQKSLSFLLLLIDKQRFNLLSEIQNWLGKLVNKNKGIVIAEITSAHNIDANTLEAIKQKLENTLLKNEKVRVESKVEPELIGGLKIRVNDKVYDGSIKGRLESLKRRLG